MPGIERIEAPPPAAEYFAARGMSPSPWSAGPDTFFAPHSHPRTKHLFVTRGSIAFNGMELSAPAGIRIPAGFEHEAVAGDGGVECVEGFE